MIDPIQAASAAERARLAPQASTRSTRASAATGGASFASELARLVSAPATSAPPAAESGSVKAVARPDNEQTTKVAGHPYARIRNGEDKGLYLNQLDGSPREGAVFRLVERDDRRFHVYGEGRDKVVVEVRAKAAPETPQPAGGATATTT